MKKSEAIKLIEKTFFRLEGACSNLREWQRFLESIRQEEKGHRHFCPDGIKCGLTLTQAVRLFAVQTIFGRFVAEDASGKIATFQAKDFFDIRTSFFAAEAIAWKASTAIRAEFQPAEMREWIKSINYAELNKDPRFQKA